MSDSAIQRAPSDTGSETNGRHSTLTHPEQRASIGKIQLQLDAIWADGIRGLREGQILTRACMSNLIILCDHDEQARRMALAIPHIVQDHPSRVLLLTRQGATEGAGLEAYVSGHYRALPGGWQVSAEQIRVVANGASEDRLPSVVRAQLIGDLPTTLWWASQQPPPMAGELFAQLASMSNQIIYDSVGWPNPTRGMLTMSRWVTAQREEYVVYNLAWRRLKHWRSLISQVLDPGVQPGALERVTRLAIDHGPHALASVCLLLGWLAYRLGWQVHSGSTTQGKQIQFQFGNAGRQLRALVTRLPEGPPAPLRLRWEWQDADGTRHSAVLANLGESRLGIVAEESDVAVRILSAPRVRLSRLVSDQMAHRTRDKLFEHALDKGNELMGVLAN